MCREKSDSGTNEGAPSKLRLGGKAQSHQQQFHSFWVQHRGMSDYSCPSVLSSDK
jgi:hypothetical protein